MITFKCPRCNLSRASFLFLTDSLVCIILYTVADNELLFAFRTVRIVRITLLLIMWLIMCLLFQLCTFILYYNADVCRKPCFE